MRVGFRPTVAADLPQVIGQALPHRIKALTAHVDDRVLGIGGIGYRPDGTVVAFVQMNEEARRYPLAIHRAGLAAMEMIRRSGEPVVVAEAQRGNPAAERWLLRLGFKPFEIGSETVFVWRREAE